MSADVLDRQVLLQLGLDVADSRFAVAFAARYHTLLAGRVDRIVTALLAQDAVAAMDAALSLKVSSTTAGVGELARLAHEIEGCVRRRDLVAAQREADGLPAAARRADAALRAYLVEHRAACPPPEPVA